RRHETPLLEKAIDCRRAALQVITRDRKPSEWARIQSNLGETLTVVCELEPGTSRLDDALAALHEALKERSRERSLLLWAQTQEKLARAHWAYFNKSGDLAQFNYARKAIGGAIKGFCVAKAQSGVDRARRLRDQMLNRPPRILKETIGSSIIHTY
ncbi:MAG: hypothetical protein J2P49_08410, partial [Methylocapsa sp.]|nr:hypothetical protein [Methylocapsa sp.]